MNLLLPEVHLINTHSFLELAWQCSGSLRLQSDIRFDVVYLMVENLQFTRLEIELLQSLFVYLLLVRHDLDQWLRSSQFGCINTRRLDSLFYGSRWQGVSRGSSRQRVLHCQRWFSARRLVMGSRQPVACRARPIKRPFNGFWGREDLITLMIHCQHCDLLFAEHHLLRLWYL